MLSNCGAREDSWESLGLQQSNQSVLKEINLKYSLEGLGLRLKLQYFGSLMQRTNSLEKTLRLGKTEDKEEKGATEDEMVGWHHRFNGHEFWVNSGNWWWTGKPGVLQPMGLRRVRHDWATELNWTEQGTKISNAVQCSQEEKQTNKLEIFCSLYRGGKRGPLGHKGCLCVSESSLPPVLRGISSIGAWSGMDIRPPSGHLKCVWFPLMSLVLSFEQMLCYCWNHW